MTSRQVALAHGHCLVEIEPAQGTGHVRSWFVARLSIVEDEGALVRPLVSEDGRRIKMQAPTEAMAMRSAIAYLETAFGALSEAPVPRTLGAASVGRPFVVTPTSMAS